MQTPEVVQVRCPIGDALFCWIGNRQMRQACGSTTAGVVAGEHPSASGGYGPPPPTMLCATVWRTLAPARRIGLIMRPVDSPHHTALCLAASRTARRPRSSSIMTVCDPPSCSRLHRRLRLATSTWPVGATWTPTSSGSESILNHRGDTRSAELRAWSAPPPATTLPTTRLRAPSRRPTTTRQKKPLIVQRETDHVSIPRSLCTVARHAQNSHRHRPIPPRAN